MHIYRHLNATNDKFNDKAFKIVLVIFRFLQIFLQAGNETHIQLDSLKKTKRTKSKKIDSKQLLNAIKFELKKSLRPNL